MGWSRRRPSRKSNRLEETYTYQDVSEQSLERGLPVRQDSGLAKEGSKTGRRSKVRKAGCGENRTSGVRREAL